MHEITKEKLKFLRKEKYCDVEEQELFLKFLKENAINKKQFAADLGVSPGTITNWVKTKKLKRKDCVEQILKRFNKYQKITGPIVTINSLLQEQKNFEEGKE